MESRATSGYIWIGTAVRFLRDQREGALVFGPDKISGNIERLYSDLDTLGLHVTKRVAWQLRDFLNDLVKKKLKKTIRSRGATSASSMPQKWPN